MSGHAWSGHVWSCMLAKDVIKLNDTIKAWLISLNIILYYS